MPVNLQWYVASPDWLTQLRTQAQSSAGRERQRYKAKQNQIRNIKNLFFRNNWLIVLKDSRPAKEVVRDSLNSVNEGIC